MNKYTIRYYYGSYYHKKVRWDATGHCFSQRSNVRQRNYDLPIPTILQWEKQAKEFKNLE